MAANGTKPRVRVAPAAPEHAEALEELQRTVFPNLADHELMKAAHFRQHQDVFPEGEFVALAADDGLFSNTGFGLVESWQKAGRPVEFHYYEQGGHGFGMYQKETTSTGWFDAWVSWLRMHGYLSRAK
mgnify:CR=1 FL=1